MFVLIEVHFKSIFRSNERWRLYSICKSFYENEECQYDDDGIKNGMIMNLWDLFGFHSQNIKETKMIKIILKQFTI